MLPTQSISFFIARAHAYLSKLDTGGEHRAERVTALHGIAERCLELSRKRRAEVVDLIPELEELRRAEEALPAQVCDRECVVCLSSAAQKSWRVLRPCGHACVCDSCSEGLRHCPLCRTEISETIRIFL